MSLGYTIDPDLDAASGFLTDLAILFAAMTGALAAALVATAVSCSRRPETSCATVDRPSAERAADASSPRIIDSAGSNSVQQKRRALARERSILRIDDPLDLVERAPGLQHIRHFA